MALVGLLVNVSMAGIATGRYQIWIRSAEKYDRVVDSIDDQLGIGKSTVGDGTDNRDAADCWYLVGGKFKHSLSHAYLAYRVVDHKPVFEMVAKPEQATVWKITATNRRGGEERGRLQASEGELKDWYLSTSKGGLTMTKEDHDNVELRRVYIHK
ncbi:MAG TPA: hypothetical protein VFE24_06865 [Pirellulales bacterium]|nr:hypothetical protein [Pirellulales bacterium]